MRPTWKELTHNWETVIIGRRCGHCGGSGFINVSTANTPEAAAYNGTQVKCPSCVNGHWLKAVDAGQFIKAMAEEIRDEIFYEMKQQIAGEITKPIADLMLEKHRADFFDHMVKEVETRIKNVEVQMLNAAGDKVRVERPLMTGDNVMVSIGDALHRATVEGLGDLPMVRVKFGGGELADISREKIVAILSKNQSEPNVGDGITYSIGNQVKRGTVLSHPPNEPIEVKEADGTTVMVHRARVLAIHTPEDFKF